jgi:hypothetical protein
VRKWLGKAAEGGVEGVARRVDDARAFRQHQQDVADAPDVALFGARMRRVKAVVILHRCRFVSAFVGHTRDHCGL